MSDVDTSGEERRRNKRWPAFTRFLDDGRVCLSNNAVNRRRTLTPHCLIENVTEEVRAMTGGALANRLAGAHGGDDQLGCTT
jgi:hypothetical protein